ncbi:hypothetical protein EV183_002316 [Coemansia sp. RSA 2336]|nr:hypothetical protein EV183_002316 [Coemansia sp. RSA 2336]
MALETPPKTMQDLIRLLNQTMGDSALGDDMGTVRKVKQLMRSYISQSQDWAQYAVYQEGSRYTRNLVDDGNGKYNLLILVWGEGQYSPIHDHAGSHCMMKLLAGKLDEELYSWPTKTTAMQMRRRASMGTDSVAYMHDKIGLHRIANPSNGEKAVSLHLYSPPYQICKTFDEHTGQAQVSSCAAKRLDRPDTCYPGIYTCPMASALPSKHAITSI